MIDLHMHSTFSDGVLSPAQLADEIAAAGLSAAALTDHDTTGGCQAFKEALLRLGIAGIYGSELSAGYPGVSMEVLALDIPERSLQEFHDYQKIMSAERRRVVRERLRLLEQLGISLRWEDVAVDKKGKERSHIGKPHIVSAMLKYGYIREWNEGFAKYLNKGCPAYVEKNEPPAEEVIAFIRDNGAVPVLAHPVHTRRSGRELFFLLEDLKKKGIAGAEIFHSDQPSPLRAEYLQMIEILGLIASGGSDFHGEAHPGVKVGVGKGDLRIPELVLDIIGSRSSGSASYYTALAAFI